MTAAFSIGGRAVGPGHPCYVIAEIGINHNGELENALALVDVAVAAGCDAVKFQKRTPELAVPKPEQDRPRDTPWGLMTYLAYRERMEFGANEFSRIDEHCRAAGITWFVSCWDAPSVDVIERFDPPVYKVASATLTDRPLLERLVATGKPLILSTGMSTIEQIEAAVGILAASDVALLHCTSSYPADPDELNLRAMDTLRERFGRVVGYSGHEIGLQASLAAVALGAALLERHITLDRAHWGSDQAASVEPDGLRRLVRDVRIVERALGDGVKRVYESELPILEKLRRVR